MIGCPPISAAAGASIADALGSVDCLSSRATATAFDHLFGPGGELRSALTILLTLYVALLAVNLLIGRSRIGVSTLTPRGMTVGLVLTFATSWTAYQSVIWTLAIGAPDQIAGAIVGTRGSATLMFANRLDLLFNAVAEAARVAQAVQGAPPQKAAGFTPADILWLGAFLLLLGSVGILIVTRIALTALLAVGPVFIVLSLFRGTRGLFEGWVKGLALFATVPLFAVLIGSGAVAIIAPLVSGFSAGEIDMRGAATVLLAAIVFNALMLIVFKVSVTLTAGWRLPGSSTRAAAAPDRSPATLSNATGALPSPWPSPIDRGGATSNDRVRELVRGIPTTAPLLDGAGGVAGGGPTARMLLIGNQSGQPDLPTPRVDDRIRGIGSRFRPTPASRNAASC